MKHIKRKYRAVCNELDRMNRVNYVMEMVRNEEEGEI